MMVCPNIPPPAATLGQTRKAVWNMPGADKYAALQRLANLAEPLRLNGFLVETQLCESRSPFRVLSEARRYRAQRLAIGTHSLTGIKQIILEALFDAIKNPDFGPQRDST